ncbi:hypothetical protein [Streptomyces sp900116325]|uniref:hypothetical protein n=1 Tax=Streptomyces sp. 900116325 TaxID=3154295 RepID=UPI0033CFA717
MQTMVRAVGVSGGQLWFEFASLSIEVCFGQPAACPQKHGKGAVRGSAALGMAEPEDGEEQRLATACSAERL